jgi:hypothetical protein
MTSNTREKSTAADPVWRAPLCLMAYSVHQTAHCSSSMRSDSCFILGLCLQPDKDSVWINYAEIILYTYSTIPMVARFSSPVQNSMGPTHPPVQWVPGLFSVGKVAGAGLDYPLPSSAVVKGTSDSTRLAATTHKFDKYRFCIYSFWTTDDERKTRSKHVEHLQH